MKKNSSPGGLRLLRLLAAGLLGILCWGCETEPASAPIFIRPPSASIRRGEAIVFTASGGYEYRWALSTPSIGTLSSASGVQTTYTSLQDPEGNAAVVQTLTLTSTVDGSAGGSGTNTASYEATTEARITHLPAGGNTAENGGSGTTPSSLRVVPAAVELDSNGESVLLTATGGVPPYTFTANADADAAPLGLLSGGSGSSRTYTRQTSGNNIVTVRDAAGASVEVQIRQPAVSGPPMPGS